tara:strand:+ start:370 stop:810 length:441 start_codon:yes stop_codon:yes gene_type:complete
MPKSILKSMTIFFTIQSFLSLFTFSVIYAGDTPSVQGTKVYFINIKDGQILKSPFLVKFGLTGEMGIAPALADWPDTGHHHLIINASPPNENKAISKKQLHLHKGQTELTIKLPPGKHTLQAVLGDYSHIPHDPPVMSEVITVTVE